MLLIPYPDRKRPASSCLRSNMTHEYLAYLIVKMYLQYLSVISDEVVWRWLKRPGAQRIFAAAPSHQGRKIRIISTVRASTVHTCQQWSACGLGGWKTSTRTLCCFEARTDLLCCRPHRDRHCNCLSLVQSARDGEYGVVLLRRRV